MKILVVLVLAMSVAACQRMEEPQPTPEQVRDQAVKKAKAMEAFTHLCDTNGGMADFQEGHKESYGRGGSRWIAAYIKCGNGLEAHFQE